MATTSKQNTFVQTSIGIDIGKDVFHIVGFNPEGKFVLLKKIQRLACTLEASVDPRREGR